MEDNGELTMMERDILTRLEDMNKNLMALSEKVGELNGKMEIISKKIDNINGVEEMVLKHEERWAFLKRTSIIIIGVISAVIAAWVGAML